MRKIVSIRHGKAVSPEGVTDDSLRILNDEGINKTRALGDQLRMLGFVPDRIIVSSASRADQTMRLIMAEIDPGDRLKLMKTMVTVVPGLYKWQELTAAAKKPEEGGLDFQLHLGVYNTEKFSGDLESFERNRVNALLEAIEGDPIGDDENVLIVSHAWVSNTALYPFGTEQLRKELREIGVEEAHALVLHGNGELEAYGPDGKVEIASLKRKPVEA
jgi:phosphohistidine phosphatase SixA